MYFNKYADPGNFFYVKDLSAQQHRGGIQLSRRSGDIYIMPLAEGLVRISSRIARTETRNRSETVLDYRAADEAVLARRGATWRVKSGGVELRVREGSGSFDFAYQGRRVLRSASAPFGVSGAKSILLLDRPRETVVYGLGEKTGKLDKSGRSYKMWNVDTVAEFPDGFMRDDFDPTYASIPLVISKYEKDYYGVLLDNPYASFFHAGLTPGPDCLIPPGGRRKADEAVLALGVEEGRFDLYLIPGPTLRDVVRRASRLMGRHELPPQWALGYHQCRWSYNSAKEVAEVAGRLAEAKIPVAAMWLDIDTMDGYRCFTFNEKTFGRRQRARCFKALRARGTRVVTIIDPGVKVDPKYSVYRQLKKKNLFCQTPEGLPFKGYVWPGETIFPDFSLPETRAYWAGLTKKHLEEGIDGIWIDMNDPSCGPVELDQMRFQHGRVKHSAYHNQYGHLMAKATFEGFQKWDPKRRPFVLTRSGSTGTQKYAALWTGDNASNEAHLAMAIPMSLNLALSGVSFNGPDVGGFAFDTTEELFVTWMKGGALFPFFRNHSSLHTRRQEPDAFSKKALATVRWCINTRAKLLPTLYNQFYLHWRDGEAVMRPLSYEFKGAAYERISDQYLIGPSVMVAPFVDVSSEVRDVVLPPGWWFSLQRGKWTRGGRTIRVRRDDAMLIFIRDGSILPCIEGASFYPQPDFRKVGFHVFVKEKSARCEYFEDDGETRAYRKGDYNLFELVAVKKGGGLGFEIKRAHQAVAGGLASANVYFYGRKPAGAKPATARWPFASYAVGKTRVRVDELSSGVV